MLSLLILCFVYTTGAQNFSIELPLDISPPLYTNINDGMYTGTTKIDKPRWYTSYSDKCGIRGGYYFNRIVGGQNAQEGEFSWQVSLQLRTGQVLRHICGGAILAEHWVITAGHCVSEVKPSALSVVSGDHNLYVFEGREQRRHVLNIFTNNFELASFTNDIALLKLDSPFLLFNRAGSSPICLPKPYERFQGLATVSGWGRLVEEGSSPHTLQQVTLPLVEKYICKSMYRQIGFSRFLHECQLCAGVPHGGKDACQGDSGGPLMCQKEDNQYYLCGIVSWGIGCGRTEFPGVYTEVSCYIGWIEHIMRSNW